jgi:hypothetical protein
MAALAGVSQQLSAEGLLGVCIEMHEVTLPITHNWKLQLEKNVASVPFAPSTAGRVETAIESESRPNVWFALLQMLQPRASETSLFCLSENPYWYSNRNRAVTRTQQAPMNVNVQPIPIATRRSCRKDTMMAAKVHLTMLLDA